MSEWYALNDEGEIVSLGQHASFNEASDYAETHQPCYVWIIDEDCARKWYRSLTILLKNTEQAHATAS